MSEFVVWIDKPGDSGLAVSTGTRGVEAPTAQAAAEIAADRHGAGSHSFVVVPKEAVVFVDIDSTHALKHKTASVRRNTGKEPR